MIPEVGGSIHLSKNASTVVPCLQTAEKQLASSYADLSLNDITQTAMVDTR